jgi:hypothetical protein
MYQNIIVLDKKLRYKLDLVVKDLSSGQIGAIRKAIIPPAFDDEKLTASSLVLADFIERLDETLGKEDRMFVLGDVWLRPSLNKTFSFNQSLGVYLQVYNFGIDQTSLAPNIESNFRIYRGDRMVLEIEDPDQRSIHFFSSGRIVLVRQLQVNLLSPGDYRLEVQVRDLIKDEEITATDRFKLIVKQN